jgi:hypothetical protein
MRDSSSVAELADFTSYSFRAAGQNATLADELRNIDRNSTYRHHDLRARVVVARPGQRGRAGAGVPK